MNASYVYQASTRKFNLLLNSADASWVPATPTQVPGNPRRQSLTIIGNGNFTLTWQGLPPMVFLGTATSVCFNTFDKLVHGNLLTKPFTASCAGANACVYETNIDDELAY